MNVISFCAAAVLAFSPVAIAAAASQHEPAASHFENAPGPVEQWYRVAGHPGGIPVIILHGGPGQGSMVFEQGVGAELERVARVVYFDQRARAARNGRRIVSFIRFRYLSRMSRPCAASLASIGWWSWAIVSGA